MRLKYYVLILAVLSSPMLNGFEVRNVLETEEVEEAQVYDVLVDEDESQEEVKEKIKAEVKLFNIDGMLLKQGISSEEVIRVKRYLQEKGYTGITPDYYFDNKTNDIVAKYKEDSGLVHNSIIDMDTYKKINEDMKLNKLNIPEIELKFTKDIPVGNWIIINKSNNTLYHLKGNDIIKKYPVATGKTPQHTPEGKFTIVTKYINPAWGGAERYKPVRGGAPNNPLGKRWMGLNIMGGGTYGIHGNSDKESIGRHVTLGCVRMFNEDVENLFELIDYGIPVWIGRESELKKYGVLFNFIVYSETAINIQ